MNSPQTYHKVGVLDGSPIVHGAEEVFAERQDHKLLEKTITEHELFGCAGDIAVVMQDAHACESCDLHL